jgi:hypothetical protein
MADIDERMDKKDQMIVAEQRKKKKFKTLYVTERKEWRKWLEQNYNREKEIWLIYPHKSSVMFRMDRQYCKKI